MIDPATWLALSLGAKAPLFALLLLLLACFWGFLLAPTRRLLLALARAARRAASPAGAKLCAACGAALSPAGEGEPPSLACPRCQGRWVGEDFVVFRCGVCRGLWFDRVEWISLGLRVLQ